MDATNDATNLAIQDSELFDRIPAPAVHEKPFDGMFLVGEFVLGKLLDYFAEVADAWDVKKEDVFLLISITPTEPRIILDDETHTVAVDYYHSGRKMNRLQRITFNKIVSNADDVAKKWNCDKYDLQLKLCSDSNGDPDLFIKHTKTGRTMNLTDK